MEGKMLLIFAVGLVWAVMGVDSACKELPPMKNFTASLIEGKHYWLYMRLPNNGTVQNKCQRTYTSVEKKEYTFATVFINKSGKDASTVNQGAMNPAGRWVITSIAPKNVPSSTHVALGAVADQWILLYSCNKKSGDFTAWVWSRTVMSPMDFLNKNGQEFGDVLESNKLSLDEFRVINQTDCEY